MFNTRGRGLLRVWGLGYRHVTPRPARYEGLLKLFEAPLFEKNVGAI